MRYYQVEMGNEYIPQSWTEFIATDDDIDDLADTMARNFAEDELYLVANDDITDDEFFDGCFSSIHEFYSFESFINAQLSFGLDYEDLEIGDSQTCRNEIMKMLEEEEERHKRNLERLMKIFTKNSELSKDDGASIYACLSVLAQKKKEEEK